MGEPITAEPYDTPEKRDNLRRYWTQPTGMASITINGLLDALDAAIKERDRLAGELRHVADMCARPAGVCFIALAEGETSG